MDLGGLCGFDSLAYKSSISSSNISISKSSSSLGFSLSINWISAELDVCFLAFNNLSEVIESSKLYIVIWCGLLEIEWMHINCLATLSCLNGSILFNAWLTLNEQSESSSASLLLLSLLVSIRWMFYPFTEITLRMNIFEYSQ